MFFLINQKKTQHTLCELHLLYVSSCVSQGRVWLIDLNPFGEVTDSLLFTWGELTSGEVAEQQVSHCILYVPYCNTLWSLNECSVCLWTCAGRPGVPLHHQRGDGATQPLSELQNSTGLCRPLHRRGCIQTYRLPQAGRSWKVAFMHDDLFVMHEHKRCLPFRR